jgi:hypothetical protein
MIQQAARLLGDRGDSYGDAGVSHQRAADIASILLNKKVSRFDIGIALLATKLSRLAHDPDHQDSAVDALNYLSFAYSWSQDRNKSSDTHENMVAASIEEGIAAAAIAQKFAPPKMRETNSATKPRVDVNDLQAQLEEVQKAAAAK